MNIFTVWQRFLNNSTVITIDRDYLNRNITFPPITLCYRDRLNETAMEEFLNLTAVRKHNKLIVDDEQRKFLWNLAHFNISNLKELIKVKRNYYDVENYVEVSLGRIFDVLEEKFY